MVANSPRISLPLIPAAEIPGERNLYFGCKRIIDVLLSSLLLLVFAPVMAVVALLVRLDSPGPAIFKQRRVGSRRVRRKGATYIEVCVFESRKFRSMRNGVSHSAHEQFLKDFIEGKTDGCNPLFKLVGDHRVTRIGRFLRKTSLDELPQLFNVLRGDMSLVGPRPVPEYEVEMYKPEHLERLRTLPGLTGLWQVRGRCQVPFEEMVRMDVEYVNKASLWLDFKIMLQTIPAVLSMRGAE